MNGHDWLAVAGVTGVLMAGLPMIRWLALQSGASAEVARKAVHVAMGVACLGFPWVFSSSHAVWMLAVIATLLLSLLRWVPSLRNGMGSALHGVERLSYGEVLFAPAVAVVFQASRGAPLMYVIPIAILTVADAAGALAGKRWGKLRYQCGGDYKSVEGSLAFLATAFLCVFLPLVYTGNCGMVQAIWIGLILATLAMMAEGLSDRGFDNLVLPLGSFFVLGRLLPLDGPALTGRFVALALLFALVILGSRWSTLNGASLLGGALLGYGCAVLADWRYALPPVAVFVCHVFTTRRFKLTKLITHRMDVVISHTIACMPWVLLNATGRISDLKGLAGISFAMAAQLAILNTATWIYLGETKPRPLRSALKGWLLAGIPGLIWFAPDFNPLAIPAGCAFLATIAAAAAVHWIRSRHHGQATLIWLAKGTIALTASLPALFFRS